MRERRGFMLVTVLLLSVILLTLGMAYLGSRSRQYESAFQAGRAAQAKALARSGMEDARVKLNRDIDFPLAMALGQNTFSYGESLVGPDGQTIGSYRVEIDVTYSEAPFYLIAIKSTGMAGPVSAPTSKHAYQAYLDIAPTSGRYYQYFRWEDLGAP